MKKPVRVVVFDDNHEYVHILADLLLRDGFDAAGIIVTAKVTPEHVAAAVRISGAKFLVADGDCNGDPDFGIKVIALCRDIPGLFILSSSGKSNYAMESVSHAFFRRKDDLVFGCKSQKERFLGIFRSQGAPLAA